MIHKTGVYEINTIVTDAPWSENCYVVKHGALQQLIIIDPGGQQEKIQECVDQSGCTLKAILITHAHHDHVGAVEGLRQQYQVPILVHRGDQRLLRQAHTYALVFAGHALKPISDVSFYDEHSWPMIDGWDIKTMHTPGHSPGSVVYDIGGSIFTGDTILYNYIGRADTPGADTMQLIASVDKLLEQWPEESMMLPGHGRTWTIREARAWWQTVRANPPQHKQFGGV